MNSFQTMLVASGKISLHMQISLFSTAIMDSTDNISSLYSIGWHKNPMYSHLCLHRASYR